MSKSDLRQPASLAQAPNPAPTTAGTTYDCICTLSARGHQAALPPPDAAAPAAVDPCVQCAPPRGAAAAPPAPGAPACFDEALAALTPGGPPLPASLRPLPAAPLVAKRARVIAPPALRHCAWLPERLQQRLVERGCTVHFAVRACC